MEVLLQPLNQTLADVGTQSIGLAVPKSDQGALMMAPGPGEILTGTHVKRRRAGACMIRPIARSARMKGKGGTGGLRSHERMKPVRQQWDLRNTDLEALPKNKQNPCHTRPRRHRHASERAGVDPPDACGKPAGRFTEDRAADR